MFEVETRESFEFWFRIPIYSIAKTLKDPCRPIDITFASIVLLYRNVTNEPRSLVLSKFELQNAQRISFGVTFVEITDRQSDKSFYFPTMTSSKSSVSLSPTFPVPGNFSRKRERIFFGQKLRNFRTKKCPPKKNLFSMMKGDSWELEVTVGLTSPTGRAPSSRSPL